jgi:competence protein ComEC
MNKKSYIFWSLLFTLAILRLWQSSYSSHPNLDNCLKQNVIGLGKIVSEPEKKESDQIFVVVADQIIKKVDLSNCGGNIQIKVKTKLYPDYSFGDRVSFEGKILEPANFASDSGRNFDYVGYLGKDEIYFEIKSAKIIKLGLDSQGVGSDRQFGNVSLITLRENFVAKLFSLKKSFITSLERNLGEPHSALAGGLVVGEKSALGKQLLDDFRKVGLIHIVVLSGYNITIVADAMRRLLLFLPRVWGIFFGGLGVAIFGIFVGGGATVVRSCLMAGIALTADLARRDYDVLRALIFVGLIMLIENPKILLHDPSFQLSFLATLGLIFLASPIENKIDFVTERFGLRGIIASTFATLIFVSPYILYTMGQISIVGVAVNILVLPFVPVTMLFVFLAGIIGMFSTFVAVPFAWVSYFLLSYELFMVNNFAKLPFASLNVGQFSPWWVVGFYGFITILLYFKFFSTLVQFRFTKKSST